MDLRVSMTLDANQRDKAENDGVSAKLRAFPSTERCNYPSRIGKHVGERRKKSHATRLAAFCVYGELTGCADALFVRS